MPSFNADLLSGFFFPPSEWFPLHKSTEGEQNVSLSIEVFYEKSLVTMPVKYNILMQISVLISLEFFA